jgi:aarF domain-containing kinase
MMIARRVVIGAGAVGTASIAYTSYTDPAFVPRMKRPLTFWVKMFPIYAHYRLTEFKLNWVKPTDAAQLREWTKDKDACFHELHEVYAPQILDLILELRGLFVKVTYII